MAQGDYLIQNQSFPSFRSDLNSTLEAINTSNSGTSRPTSAVAGTVWLDVTNATNPTLKFFDGTDDISLAQLDYSANTVNWLDSTVSVDVVGDTTPQLGGNLDVNGNSIVSVSNGNITFTPDGTGKVIIDGLSHPTADGTSGQFMKTDGAGNLSFDTVDLTNLSASNLTSGTLPDARFPSVLPAVSGANLTNLPSGGKVLQVVSTEKTDTFSSSSTSFVDVTGLSLNITPSATSSKVLVLINIGSSNSNGYKYGFRLIRAGTTINEGDSAGSRAQVSIGLLSSVQQSFESSSILHLDSPSSTSSTNYQIQGFTEGGGTFYINRAFDDGDTSSRTRSSCNMTLIEIGT